MTAKLDLIHTWTFIANKLSQMVSSSNVRRCILGMALVFLLATFTFRLQIFSTLYSLGQVALHTIGRVPYGDPYP